MIFGTATIVPWRWIQVEIRNPEVDTRCMMTCSCYRLCIKFLLRNPGKTIPSIDICFDDCWSFEVVQEAIWLVIIKYAFESCLVPGFALQARQSLNSHALPIDFKSCVRIYLGYVSKLLDQLMVVWSVVHVFVCVWLVQDILGISQVKQILTMGFVGQ